MDRLWAPWRAQYIRDSSESTETEPECFLCRALASEDDRANLLVWRRSNSIVVLNRYPYNNGHLLVAPTVHRGTLEELAGVAPLEPIETLQRIVRILDRI